VFLVCALFAGVAVVSIFVFLVVGGGQAVGEIGVLQFLFSSEWGSYGIFNFVLASVISAVGALVVGGVLGVFVAVYICCFASGRVRAILNVCVNVLACMPSIVLAFFGVRVVVSALGVFSVTGDGSGIVAVSIMLGIMIAPTVAVLSKIAIAGKMNAGGSGGVGGARGGSDSTYGTARALGLSSEQAVFGVVLPASKSGIFTALTLGAGRAVGETIIVLLLGGGNTNIPYAPFIPFRTLSSNIALEMSYASALQQGALIASGLVLLIIVVALAASIWLFSTQKTISPNHILGRASIAKICKRLSQTISLVLVTALTAIVGYIFLQGASHISINLIFGSFQFSGAPTLLSSLVTTLMFVGLTLLLVVPIGVMAAIYLSEYSRPDSPFYKLIDGCLSVLSSIPSVVFGLFGLVFFVGFLGFGVSILAGCFTVALMVLPIVVKASGDSISNVSAEVKSAAYALGCSKLGVIVKVVLPLALVGILAGIVLAISRKLSESAALLFTMGASLGSLPTGYSSSGTTLSVALFALMREGGSAGYAYGAALVLVSVVLVFCLAYELLQYRLNRFAI